MIGTETRINCPRCQDQRQRLYIKKTHKGELRFCHNNNCYKHDSFVRNGQNTPKDIIALAKNIIKVSEDTHEIEQSNISLPYDHTYVISKEGERWLSKYSITTREKIDNKIGYSPSLNRLILPVYIDDKLVYWQGRNLGIITKTNPKYLNIRTKGAKNVFFHTYWCCNNECGDDEGLCLKCKNIVVVEDILSAIKVSRVCNSLALLGSYVPKTILSTIPTDTKKLFIWLDEDKYFTALKEARSLASLTALAVKVVRTKEDPKCYDEQEIKRILYEC